MSAIDQAEMPGTRAAVLPYAGTIFLSAFLLFLVQPIIAKQILPWFGGSSAVWTTAPVVPRSCGGADHSAGVLPVDVAGRIRVCRPDAATRCSAANAAAHLAAA